MNKMKVYFRGVELEAIYGFDHDIVELSAIYLRGVDIMALVGVDTVEHLEFHIQDQLVQQDICRSEYKEER